ncbi:MAG: hypothetical protein MZV65_18405 [Chromatiales bacterium]|nr:hypothetical protein [Chromatiales bacterium]
MAPNVRGVGAPGRRTVYSMCGMCAVRCPMEVTVENGRVTWIAGQSARRGHRRQPLREGCGRPRLRVRRPAAADAADPQGPARQRPVAAGVLGRGPRLHRRQAEGDDRGLRPARHRALRSRRLLHRPDPDLRAGARLAELLQPRRLLQRQRPQRRALDLRLPARPGSSSTTRTRSTSCSTAATSSNRSWSRRPRPSWPRVANGMRVTYIDPRATVTACKATRYWQVRPEQRLRAEPRPHPRGPEDRKPTTRSSSNASSPAWTPCARRSRTRRRNGRKPTPAFPPPSCAPSSRRSPAEAPQRDLPSGLDVGASQAVVPRQPQRR